ncbi:hypothetical protein [Demequina aurantiaca]|uniref:hypothetical protein n=1 Tax=Demequina aurantiaca TaxID=676200 RepID=UPI003D32FFC6
MPLSLVTGWKIDRFHGSVVAAQDPSDAIPSDCRLVVETSNGQKVTFDTSSAGDTNRPKFHWDDLVAVMGLLSK